MIVRGRPRCAQKTSSRVYVIFTGALAARAATVYPVKAFGQTRDMLARDADTAVLDRETQPLAFRLPRQHDIAAFRRVTHGIGYQVAKGGMQLLGTAPQPLIAVFFQPDMMASLLQAFGLHHQGIQHVLHVHFLRHHRLGAVFQPGQGQQVFHQALHAP